MHGVSVVVANIEANMGLSKRRLFLLLWIIGLAVSFLSLVISAMWLLIINLAPEGDRHSPWLPVVALVALFSSILCWKRCGFQFDKMEGGEFD